MESQREYELLLEDWNATKMEYPMVLLHEVFESQVVPCSARIAVSCHGDVLTYKELNARSNRIAHALRLSGASRGQRIGLCVERSVDMLAAILGILKTGAAYVPLDPGFPVERLRFMAEDAELTLLVSTTALADSFNLPRERQLLLDADASKLQSEPTQTLAPDTELDARPEDPAYIIYTSGSTGKPKGVVVPHRAVVNFLNSMGQEPGLTADDVLVAVTTLSFDIAVLELYLPLMQGATVVIARREEAMDGQALSQLLEQHQATIMQATPVTWRLLLEAGWKGNQNFKALVGGEALPKDLADQLLEQNIELWNMYGPTETTVWSTCAHITDTAQGINIGKPIANTTVYVLDEQQRLCPIGVPGELYIGGEGVTLGYWNQPARTAERFIKHPFSSTAGATLYRTGDRVCWNNDGTLAHQGRLDFQVKVRGFRIELGEIESEIVNFDGVKEAVVIVREDILGDQKLVAYIVTSSDEFTDTVLKQRLTERLPPYMVPSAYVLLDALPLTANGKIDRKSLPMPDRSHALETYAESRNETEQVLVDIWSDILGLERVGINDNFFEIGGHSLLAIKIVASMRRAGMQVYARDIFLNPTVAKLAMVTNNEPQTVEVPPNLIPNDSSEITPEMLPLVDLSNEEIASVVGVVSGGVANIQDIYPLTELQRGLLFHHQLATEGDGYLTRTLFVFTDRNRLDAFLQAIQAVIDRHDILRTCFIWEGLSEPVQVILRKVSLIVEELEFSHSEEDVAKQIKERFDPRSYRLDVRQAPLIHMSVSYDPKNKQWLMQQLVHHLIDDQITMNLVRDEIGLHLSDKTSELSEPIPFREFIFLSQSKAAQSKVGVEEHKAFFKELLGDVEEPTVPFGLTDTHVDEFDISEASHIIEPETSRRIRELARATGVTVASVFHQAWAQVLSRISGYDDVVFGTVLSGRMQVGGRADRVLGTCINTLPIRLKTSEDTVQRAVQSTHKILTELVRHEHASLAAAQQCSAVEPNTPLFGSLLNYRQGEGAGPINGHDDIKILDFEERTNYPLTLNIDDTEDFFRIVAQAQAPINPRRICDYLQVVLKEMIRALGDTPSQLIQDLEVVPDVEQQRILIDWNNTGREYGSHNRLHRLIEEQAACTPDLVALEYEGKTLTYKEMNQRSNQLANYLRKNGVGSDVFVGVFAERSFEMVLALLAIVKAGGAYVPLDPAYPAERLANMLEDTQAPIVLAQPHLLDRLPLHPNVVSLDDSLDFISQEPVSNLEDNGAPDDLAYVIFTSGSTGRPKGVMIEHQSICNRLLWMQEEYQLTTEDIVLQKTQYSFDVSVWEFFWPLMTGARLVIARPEGHRDPTYIADVIKNSKITVLHFVPSMLQVFLVEKGIEKCDSLRLVLCSGEALPHDLQERFYESLPSASLHNLYGPTEAAVDVTYWACQSGDDRRTVPIGRPVANTQIYILDSNMRPVPMGVAGELHIGGVQVARGYVGRDDLTVERFIPDPFSSRPDAKLYKTGDLAKHLDDGAIEYLGRLDFQVKIRGQRIELGEIEATISAHNKVDQCVVMAREDTPGDQRLVAYVTPPNDTVSENELSTYLAGVLPSHMVPTSFVFMEEFPLTVSGKLDRKKLPLPGMAASSSAYIAPQTKEEQIICEIWAELLRVERVGINDNFFELGGHSLLAISMVESLRKKGLEVDVRTIFLYPTVAGLASATNDVSEKMVVPVNRIKPDSDKIIPEMLPLVSLKQEEIDSIVMSVPGGVSNIQDIYPLTPLQEGFLFHHQMNTDSDVYLMSYQFSFNSRQKLDEYLSAMQVVVNRHDILRTAVLWEHLSAPIQVVLRQAPLAIEELDFDNAAGDISEQMHSRCNLFNFRLDVRTAPMMRLSVAYDAPNSRWLLQQVVHHLIEDQATMKMQESEVHALMIGSDVFPTPMPFRNFVTQTQLAANEEEHLAFFQHLLGDVVEPTNPFELVDLYDDASSIGHEYTLIEGAFAHRLRDLCRAHGVTVASLFHLAWALVLGRVSGHDDVVFGTVLMGRLQSISDAGQIMGPCINTLPVRVQMSDVSVVESLISTHTMLAEIMLHESTSLADAQRCSAVSADAQLFSSILNYRHSESAQNSSATNRLNDSGGSDLWLFEKVSGREFVSFIERTNYPFELTVDDFGDRFRLEVQVQEPVNPKRVANYLLTAIEQLVNKLEHSADAMLSSLSILPDTEKATLVSDWNATETDYPIGLLHEVFESQVIPCSDRIAVSCGNETLSYHELSTRSNRIAYALRTSGASRGQRIGLCVERSVDMLAAVLGILKTGAAYVPLDPGFPVERLRFMADDAELTLLVSTSTLADSFNLPRERQLLLDADASKLLSESNQMLTPDIELDARPEDPAYIIYTSGSTGKPKGVVVPHRAVVNFLSSMAREPGLTIDDVLVAVTTLSFDIAVLELYLPLMQGTTVVIASREEAMDGYALSQLLEQHQATIMQATPVTWRLLLEAGWKGSKNFKALVGGEALPKDLADQLLGHNIELWNMYGPTETTVWSTCARIEDTASGISIGKPIANTTVYVLDEQQRLCPIGVPGELYIGGDGVTLGYWNQPALTAERFIKNPFSPTAGATLYRTGDRVCWGNDGTLEHQGRLDFQVKVRGFRIELGEIEVALAEYPNILQVAVYLWSVGPDDVRIVACCVPTKTGALAPANLRKHLRARLPEYMIPQYFLPMDEIPLTPNGKVDQNQLPTPSTAESSIGRHEAPANSVEITIAEIWTALIQPVRTIGRDDKFFEMGGHSLLAMRAMQQMEHELGVTLNIRLLLQESVADIAVQCQPKNVFPDGGEQDAVKLSSECSAHDSEAFYFGPSEQQLLGIYHPPTGNDCQVLTIICPPLFSEFTRTHRALRELAISVAELGHHVFRFDYRGTGDSFGDLEEMTASDWIQDIELAIREGCEISGCNAVRILGVRTGALLACKSIGAVSGVQRIVLWDPIADGTDYLQTLRRAQKNSIKQNIDLSRAEKREATHECDHGGGYRLSRGMIDEFRLLDSRVYSSVPKNKLQVVHTSSDSGFPVNGVARDVVQFSCDWENQSEDLIFAQPVLEKLVICLTKS